MHNEGRLPPYLIPPPTMRRTVAIDVGLGLLLVNLSHMKMSTMVNADARAQLTEGRKTML